MKRSGTSRLENLRKAVKDLGEQSRALIDLRYGRELTMEEIGKVYGISKAAVSNEAENTPRKFEELCHMTGPSTFFIFLVYKSAVSVLISRG